MKIKLKPFRYADETFYPIERVRLRIRGVDDGRSDYAWYLLCRTKNIPALAYFREDS